MKNNKYFTPDIEDFYVGVVYEKYSQGLQIDEFGRFLPEETRDNEVKWREGVIKYPSDIVHLKIALDKETVRIPYLTKEQIEAEGWTSFITEYEGDIVPEKMTYTFFREDRNYMLGWWFNINKITLIIKDPSLVLDYYTEPTFRGECKDINTFRKIIKLLGI